VLEENDESQKLQARTLDGSTAPHCKHVFVTGAFCAADAPTPVRSEPDENNTKEKARKRKLKEMFRIRHQEINGWRLTRCRVV
jgi:hypothetical protein